MKNICFTIADISNCGGTERVCTKIANALCEKGYNIHILTGETVKPPFFHCDPRIKIGRMLTNAFERRLRYKKWYRRWKCRRYFLKNKIDVVIDVDNLMSRFTLPAVQGTNIKTISWNNFSYDYCQKYDTHHDALDFIRRYADRMVVLTKADRLLYITHESINPNSIVSIYNPLSFEEPTFAERNAKKVMAIGRIAWEKGFDLLLESWQLVEKEIDDWYLEIVCGMGDYNMLQQEAESRGLKHVSCVASVNDVRSKLSEAGIFVLPSRSEGFGLVLIEAATMSLPLVSFDCPSGPNEIIQDGKNGLLVEPENTTLLAQAILQLIKDDDLRKKVGKKAFESSKQFSICSILPQWIDLIENL